jgi:hypothetical protein
VHVPKQISMQNAGARIRLRTRPGVASSLLNPRKLVFSVRHWLLTGCNRTGCSNELRLVGYDSAAAGAGSALGRWRGIHGR